MLTRKQQLSFLKPDGVAPFPQAVPSVCCLTGQRTADAMMGRGGGEKSEEWRERRKAGVCRQIGETKKMTISVGEIQENMCVPSNTSRTPRRERVVRCPSPTLAPRTLSSSALTSEIWLGAFRQRERRAR